MCLRSALLAVQHDDQFSSRYIYPNLASVHVLHATEYGNTGLQGYFTAVVAALYCVWLHRVLHKEART